MKTSIKLKLFLTSLLLPSICFSGSSEDIAKDLANPVANLISIPVQFNYDSEIGAGEGKRVTVNIQPVIPFDISANYNLISRTIIPIVKSYDFDNKDDEFGLGDTVQSFFLSPKAPSSGGWITGYGAVVLLPTGKDGLSTEKWGIGPTAVALHQANGWTYGALANHIWSVAGNDKTPDVNATFFQPFVTYTNSSGLSYNFDVESTYNWENDQISVPLNATISKVVKVGDQMMSVSAGVRYWAKSADSDPEGWGARLNFTFLIPE